MFLIEQFTQHSPPLPSIFLNSSGPPPPDVHFDVDLGELERQEGMGHDAVPDPSSHDAVVETQIRRPRRAYPLTLGLVMHGLADGLALGVSALSNTETDLSLVVFLALIIHKGM